MSITGGTPVNRHWLVVLQNGVPAIDWGDGIYQDILTGLFIHGTETDVSHTIMDDELEQLKHTNHIYQYDAHNVYIYPLPEPPHSTID